LVERRPGGWLIRVRRHWDEAEAPMNQRRPVGRRWHQGESAG
jgi:hypothetical protein